MRLSSWPKPHRRRLPFLLIFVAVHLLPCFALSVDDSSSVPFSQQRGRQQYLKQQQQQRIVNGQRQSMPGIWKLTSDALPYELDIRSRLDKRFSNEKIQDDDLNNSDDGGETILLKLNEDGTFKQCDEGYREGRWVTGRWTFRLVSPSENDADSNQERGDMLMLLLAMNRQYFGPPFDVLLEATNTIHCSSSSSSSGGGGNNDNDNDNNNNNNNNINNDIANEIIDRGVSTSGEGRKSSVTDDPSPATAFKRWRGVVRKGKFLRPVPGKHPLDDSNDKDGTPVTQMTVTDILEDPESLGTFFLEQALTAQSINGRMSRRQHSTGNSSGTGDGSISKSSSFTEEDSGGTFFSPPSSPDDGVFQ